MRFKFLLWLLKFSARNLYIYIDKNGDGKLDKSELQSVLNILNNLHKKIKSHNKFKNDKN